MTWADVATAPGTMVDDDEGVAGSIPGTMVDEDWLGSMTTAVWEASAVGTVVLEPPVKSVTPGVSSKKLLCCTTVADEAVLVIWSPTVVVAVAATSFVTAEVL